MQKRRNTIIAKKKERRPRLNEEITAPEVLLVDGEDSIRLSASDALARAREQELDLIEISPKANPPVVKITDFGRYMYQQKKKEQKQKAHNKQTEVKMLRFSFRTEKHDLDRILDRAREFLDERHLVKLVVRLRGREMTNKDYAKQKLAGLVTQLTDVADVEQEVKPQGNQFSAIVRPKRGN
ncbi:MAG: translation initiation factor IF-3 [Candidatus Peregrinibacteria bacterium]|nr:translation initiation factor IF-3 [Candidatus Peregrinibacteria bacterium]MCB9808077.1 translation initiation factor IF-3 [Candidatus Peribacteria bacterium]